MKILRIIVLAALIAVGLDLATTPASAEDGITTTDVSQGVTAEELVGTLLGDGVSVSNITYTGADAAAGTFAGGADILGFAEGIVLSSGRVDAVVGPNESDGTSFNNGAPGDVDLTTLANQITYDAAVLEFDFMITAASPEVELLFSYVFGSEEYNEYVDRFNDVFGFFVDGAGGNCATVGDPPVPVSINTINKEDNAELYRNNDPTDGPPTINIELDGLTTVLECRAMVTTGETHHMKLAIADAGDSALDSGVFLAANSFTFVQETTLDAKPSVAEVGPGAAVNIPRLIATLHSAETGEPVEGRTVTFTSGGTELCTAVTDSAGQAVCEDIATSLQAILGLTYEASFAGDDVYIASSDTGQLLRVQGQDLL